MGGSLSPSVIRVTAQFFLVLVKSPLCLEPWLSILRRALLGRYKDVYSTAPLRL